MTTHGPAVLTFMMNVGYVDRCLNRSFGLGAVFPATVSQHVGNPICDINDGVLTQICEGRYSDFLKSLNNDWANALEL